MESFLSHDRYRWLWVSVSLVLILLAAHFMLTPAGGHRGDTVWGYTLGILAFLGIGYLMAYGIRRRTFHAAKTTLKGWLSAHVWLGLSLILIVPLHSGFAFGINVHSLAYLVMCVVIVSGIWGAVNYRTLAPQIEAHRGGGSLKSLIEQYHMLGENLAGMMQDKSDASLRLWNECDVTIPKSLWKLIARRLPLPPLQESISKQVMSLPETERGSALTIVQLCEKRRALVIRIQKELRISARLKLWLLLHLPLSFALLVLVIFHMIVVFLYR